MSHPLLAVRPVKKSLLLVICSNRGLCGGYNGAILRESVALTRQMKSENLAYDMELSGKRAIAFFRYQGIRGTQNYTNFEDKPTFQEVEQLANSYIKLFVSGQIDRVQVAYTKFINAARQQAVVETLLPLSGMTEDISRHKAATGSGESSKNIPYEFLPSAEDILEEIVPAAFKARLFKCFLDAAVSEQIARRVAMKAATENAADLIKSLSQQYNRARQANITKEISELIAGSEALK